MSFKNRVNSSLATWIWLTAAAGLVFASLDNQFEFEFGTENIPHPAKLATGGEDAYYANKYLLCVADGVGSWANEGIDAGKYSRKLTSNVDALFAKSPEKYTAKPKSLVIDATIANFEIGSSTIVVVIIDPKTGVINASQLGDSCYMVLRPDPLTGKLAIFARSHEQQHGFNFPYQVGTDGDSPTAALEFSHQLKYGDIVVVGSDGMFDNLYDETTLEEVEKLKASTPAAIAKRLAQLSFKLSVNKNYFSPFAKFARVNKVKFMGGKMDDIAIAVGFVAKPKTQEELTAASFEKAVLKESQKSTSNAPQNSKPQYNSLIDAALKDSSRNPLVNSPA